MTHVLKPDSDDILKFIDELRAASWLDKPREWWPKYLFHFSDINNIVSILTSGMLLSRKRLNRALEHQDIASPKIIRGTEDFWKGHVRLYFRPRTPMQYSIEGVRSPKNFNYNAHCPIPVVLLFDSKSILTREDSRFSEGNLGAHRQVAVGNTADFLRQIPFNKVYHDTSNYGLTESEWSSIRFHRHAEVIIPNELDLSTLKSINCRSEAELEMLKNLLDDDVLERYEDRISARNSAKLFRSKSNTYVLQASLDAQSISFKLKTTCDDSKFNAYLKITELNTGKCYTWTNESFAPKYNLGFKLAKLEDPSHYTVELYFDDHLIYKNVYNSEDDWPF